MLLVMKFCESAFHSSIIVGLNSSTFVGVSVNTLLKGSRDGIVDGVKIRTICRPHCRFNEVNAFMTKKFNCPERSVRWSYILLQSPVVLSASLSNFQQQSIGKHIFTISIVVYLCSRCHKYNSGPSHLRDSDGDHNRLAEMCMLKENFFRRDICFLRSR